MSLNENFEAAKNLAVEAAQAAAAKAKELAAIAKANLSIYTEEDKVKKAELEIGKLYYRDYAVGEELDQAEYLPWCQKIDESKKTIEELRDYIDAIRAKDAPVDAASSEIEIVVKDEEAAPEAPAAVEAPKEEPAQNEEI